MDAEVADVPVQQPSPKKLSVDEFAAKIKAKYPSYAHIDNSELTQKIIAKYPEYADHVDVPKKASGVESPQIPKSAADWNEFLKQQDVSNTGLEQSMNGSKPSPSGNPAIDQYWNQLNPQEQKALSQGTDKTIDQHTGDIIHATPREQQGDYAYAQTLPGKIQNGLTYLAQKATKGGLQAVKGAAYLSNLMDKPMHSDAVNNEIENKTKQGFDSADKSTDLLSPTSQAQVENSKIMSNLGGLAEFLPSAAAAEGTGGATLYLQMTGQGKELMDKAEENGIKVNPAVKNAFILGYGAVGGYLMHGAGETIFNSLGTNLKNDVISDITANAIKEAAGKDLTAEGFNNLLKQGAKEFPEKVLQGGTNFLQNSKHAITNLVAQKIADFTLKKGADYANEASGNKTIFNESPGTLPEGIGDAMKTGMAFGALGSISDATKLTPLSNYKNAVVDGLMKDPSDANINATKQFIEQHGQQQGWTPDEIKATTDHVDQIGKIAKSLPSSIPPDKTEKAVDIVINRNKLQEQLDESTKQRDPALKDVVSPGEQLMVDKIDQANDKLRDLATGKRTTYSKGIGEEEGKFFKTINGKKEEITPERYQLEKLERDAKVETKTNEIADNIGLKDKELSKNNLSNKSTDNESSNQESGSESEKAEGQKSNESKKGMADESQENNVTTGGDEPPVTGIRHEDTKKEREAEGVPQPERKPKTKPEIAAEGKRLVDEGDIDPEGLAESVIKNPRPLSAEHEEALLYQKKRWQNRVTKLENEINTGSLDEATIAQHKAETARLRDLIEKNRQATDLAGSELGRGLGHRTDTMNEDYTKNAVDRSMQAANNGKAIDPELQKKNDESTKRIADLESKLQEREEEIKKLNEAEAAKQRTTKRESLKKERADLVQKLHEIARKSMSSAGANKLPVDMLVPLAKLAKNYVHDGILTLAEVVEKIHDDLQQKFSKDDIKAAIEPDFDKYLKEDNAERLDKSKSRLQTKLTKLRDGTYHAIKRRTIAVDKEYLRIKADIDREQGIINKRREKLELANKSWLEQRRQGLIKWTRNVKLGGVGVLAKLASTGITTAALKIPEEIVGGIYSKILPKIAKGSELEGGVHVKALAQGYTDGIMEGIKDAYNILNIRKGGKSDIDALYGKNKLPAEALEFLGHLHSAIKAPVKRTIFKYSLEKRTALALSKGIDVSEPTVQAKLAMDAYKDANRAIFMNDNALTKKISMLLNEHSDEPFDKVISTIGKILVPFAKVSTNIALSTGRYVAGLPLGVGQLLYRDFTLSFKNLKPEEKDLILHNLKRGTLGGAAVLMGFFNPQNVGGFYQPGEKRKDGDVKARHIKMFGHEIPEILTEHPVYQAMQIGATFRRVLDHYTETGKNDADWAASLAATAGLVDGFSYADESQRFSEGLSTPTKGSYFVGELAKGNIIPQLSSEMAKHMDTKDGSMFTFSEDNMQKRKTDDTHGITEAIKTHFQSAIPGWREGLDVGVKAEDLKLAKIKMSNGDEYKLNDKQLAERQKYNEEFVKEHGAKLEQSFRKRAEHEKSLREKIKERQKYWKDHNVSTADQTKFKQELIDDFVEKSIKKRAEEYSKGQLLKKYRIGTDESGKGIYKLKKVED